MGELPNVIAMIQDWGVERPPKEVAVLERGK